MRSGLKAVTVLLLVLSLGLHWAMLQTVAWTGMLIANSRDGSFRDAITKTFDGQHPCSLCLAVKSGRVEEKNQDHQKYKPVMKLDFALIWQGLDFALSSDRQEILAPHLFMPPRNVSPPKPPPRLGLSSFGNAVA
jgi:hypothetical protein